MDACGPGAGGEGISWPEVGATPLDILRGQERPIARPAPAGSPASFRSTETLRTQVLLSRAGDPPGWKRLATVRVTRPPGAGPRAAPPPTWKGACAFKASPTLAGRGGWGGRGASKRSKRLPLPLTHRGLSCTTALEPINSSPAFERRPLHSLSMVLHVSRAKKRLYNSKILHTIN